MQTIFVQWSDPNGDSILSVFSCAQNESEYPHQGEITSGDPRYVTYYNSLPSDQARMGLVKPGE